jgi:hypothetical protein
MLPARYRNQKSGYCFHSSTWQFPLWTTWICPNKVREIKQLQRGTSFYQLLFKYYWYICVHNVQHRTLNVWFYHSNDNIKCNTEKIKENLLDCIISICRIYNKSFAECKYAILKVMKCFKRRLHFDGNSSNQTQTSVVESPLHFTDSSYIGMRTKPHAGT